MKNTALFAGSLVCAIALAGCDGIEISAQTRAQGRFERTLTVNGAVELSVRTGSGDIQVRTGEGSRVVVVGRVAAADRDGQAGAERVRVVEANPPIEQTGNVIRIGDTNEDPRYREVRIWLQITVPAATQLTARTGSGDQTIASLRGPIRAQTGSGDITIAGTGGSLTAQTGSGDIRVDAVSGEIQVRTGSGDVDVRQMVKANVDARTGSGDVTLGLPADASFTLDARTGSGSIESAHPLTTQGTFRRNHIQGVVRGGTNTVQVTTGSGSIRIR